MRSCPKVFIILFSLTVCGSHSISPVYSNVQLLPQSVQTQRAELKNLKFDAAVLITSDSGKKEGGIVAVNKLERAGHRVLKVVHLKNDLMNIKTYLSKLTASKISIVVCVGGTGIAPRNNTVEAVDSFIEKKLPGFGELFRYLTYKKWQHVSEDVGLLAMDTRACAGTKDKTVIYAVPGSPDAVELAMDEIIIPETPYLLGQLNK